MDPVLAPHECPGFSRSLRTPDHPWGRLDLTQREREVVREGNRAHKIGTALVAAVLSRGGLFGYEYLTPVSTSPLTLGALPILQHAGHVLRRTPWLAIVGGKEGFQIGSEWSDEGLVRHMVPNDRHPYAMPQEFEPMAMPMATRTVVSESSSQNGDPDSSWVVDS